MPETKEPISIVDHFLFIINRGQYSGTFSHYEYTAWVNQTPDGIEAWTDYCSDLWKSIRKEGVLLYGGGTAPDEALADLFENLLKGQAALTELRVYLRGLFVTRGRLAMWWN